MEVDKNEDSTYVDVLSLEKTCMKINLGVSFHFMFGSLTVRVCDHGYEGQQAIKKVEGFQF